MLLARARGPHSSCHRTSRGERPAIIRDADRRRKVRRPARRGSRRDAGAPGGACRWPPLTERDTEPARIVGWTGAAPACCIPRSPLSRGGGRAPGEGGQGVRAAAGVRAAQAPCCAPGTASSGARAPDPALRTGLQAPEHPFRASGTPGIGPPKVGNDSPKLGEATPRLGTALPKKGTTLPRLGERFPTLGELSLKRERPSQMWERPPQAWESPSLPFCGNLLPAGRLGDRSRAADDAVGGDGPPWSPAADGRR